MNDLELRIDGEPVDPAESWTLHWLDRAGGVVLLRRADGTGSRLALVEGASRDWVVTLAGRRIGVEASTWRERVLAEAEVAARAHAGPIDIRATLPGLIVAVHATEDAEVGEGDPLVTIEAMKMQNEVRAPRGGRITEVAVEAGQTVAAGALLVRLA